MTILFMDTLDNDQCYTLLMQTLVCMDTFVIEMAHGTMVIACLPQLVACKMMWVQTPNSAPIIAANVSKMVTFL